MATETPRFVPVPQPPELADVVRRASFDLDASSSREPAEVARGSGLDLFSMHCWNHLVVIIDMLYCSKFIRTVRCPLHRAKNIAVLRSTPEECIRDDFSYYDGGLLLSNAGEGLSYFYWAMGSKKQQTSFDVYLLQDGCWASYSSSVSDIPKFRLMVPALLGDAKIYSVAILSSTYNLVLVDLVSSCLSLFKFPEEVELGPSFVLSLADDSGVHLTLVKGFQLRIWLHRMDSNGAGNWFLLQTVCLREICANHMIPTCTFEDGYNSVVAIHAVRDNGDLVFLEMRNVLYLFDVKCKAMKKVYEMEVEDRYLYTVSPLMMVWPPKFPVMTDDAIVTKNDQPARSLNVTVVKRGQYFSDGKIRKAVHISSSF